MALMALLVKLGSCEVHIMDVNYSTTFFTFHSMAASFGQQISSGGIRGVAFEAIPSYACEPIQPPPHLELFNTLVVAFIYIFRVFILLLSGVGSQSFLVMETARSRTKYATQ